MSNTLVQFRADEVTKKKATKICERLGIDLPTYLRMSMARIVQEDGIPFELKLRNYPNNRGIELMREISREAERNGTANMTLNEINEEIAAARNAVK